LRINQKLFEAHLITEKQFGFLESVRTEKVVSLYYELRLVLYLGIMLLTGGLGYLAYENIGSIGYILLMLLMAGLIAFGYYYILKKSKPYSVFKVDHGSVYLDYLVVLIALLIIGLFSYVQIYFDLIEIPINWTSLISAALFFYMAYRFDNKILLSMAITALIATFGLTITPVGWIKGEWFQTTHLYIISIVSGIGLVVLGYYLAKKSIKQHFLFSYQNYGLLLFYVGLLSAIFDSHNGILYALITSVASVLILIYSWETKQFLFFLYSMLTAYIAVTFLVFNWLTETDSGFILMMYYFPITCISAIVFLISKKAHFKDD